MIEENEGPEVLVKSRFILVGCFDWPQVDYLCRLFNEKGQFILVWGFWPMALMQLEFRPFASLHNNLSS